MHVVRIVSTSSRCSRRRPRPGRERRARRTELRQDSDCGTASRVRCRRLGVCGAFLPPERIVQRPPAITGDQGVRSRPCNAHSDCADGMVC